MYILIFKTIFLAKKFLSSLSLSTDETSYTFNLSSHHLTDKTCMVISKLLVNDQKFTGLLLNDCSLSNEGKHANILNKQKRLIAF